MDTVKEAMTERVVCIPAHATLEQAARILIENHVSGAPVVDGSEHLVGVLSEFQLLVLAYNPMSKCEPVSQYMTKDVVSVGPDTTLSEVANLLIVRRIRRIPVVSENRILGIISRSDLLRHALKNKRVAKQMSQIMATGLADAGQNQSPVTAVDVAPPGDCQSHANP
jgi:tRNA nucleotidyltransferase (CCA-adding enzyme)